MGYTKLFSSNITPNKPRTTSNNPVSNILYTKFITSSPFVSSLSPKKAEISPSPPTSSKSSLLPPAWLGWSWNTSAMIWPSQLGFFSVLVFKLFFCPFYPPRWPQLPRFSCCCIGWWSASQLAKGCYQILARKAFAWAVSPTRFQSLMAPSLQHLLIKR